ncbi:hypothetical protein H4R24_005398 [Coemansia sp. RSA 988]|nr:hypothetical protein H4R24_005398 [Coemansia sp. RSA 988]
MPKKRLAVGVPASLNLKAELERAQSESRLGGSRAAKSKSQQPGELGVANSGVDVRARQDKLALDREKGLGTRHSGSSRKRLEEKARIYDMLSGLGNSVDGASSVPNIDAMQLERILEEGSVDFVRKQQEQRAKSVSKDTSSAARSNSPDSDGSTVEIVDEFGRSRMVPRRRAREYIHSQSSGDSDDDSSSACSADEGRAATDAVRRNDSAGYYQLSADYVEREDQLAMLRGLHSETTKIRQEGTMSVAEMQMLQRRRRRDLIRNSLRRTEPPHTDARESRAQSPHCL